MPNNILKSKESLRRISFHMRQAPLSSFATETVEYLRNLVVVGWIVVVVDVEFVLDLQLLDFEVTSLWPVKMGGSGIVGE